MNRSLKVLFMAIFVALIYSSTIVKVGGQFNRSDPTPGSEWRRSSGIDLTITQPTDDPTAIWVNQAITCSATVTDTDEYSNDNGNTWYTYSDDVTSGSTAADYHIWWSCSAGSFTEIYGTTTTYIAPGIDVVGDELDVTLIAHADDFNRGSDVLGADDPAVQKQKVAKVFPVTLTKSQNGKVGDAGHPWGAAAIPAVVGGGQLGWVEFGKPQVGVPPVNTELDGGATYFEAKPGANAPANLPNLTWKQTKDGIKKHKPPHVPAGQFDINGWHVDYSGGGNDPDSPAANYPYMENAHFFDAPGFAAGANNDTAIGPPDNWTDDSFDMTYSTWVEDGNGNRMSTFVNWGVQFTLTVVNNKWSVTAHTL